MRHYMHIWLCCLPFVLFANEKNDSTETQRLTVKGYVKYMQQAFFVKQIEQLQTANLIHNRINMQYEINKHMYVRTDLRNRIFYGELIRQNPGYAAMLENPNDYTDMTRVWFNKDALILHSVIDRAYLNYRTNKLEVSIGRQRINWGINTVWTPNDIFNTYNFFDFDYEERPGSDGVRIQYTPGGFSAVELAYKAGRNKEEHMAAMLYRMNKWNYDFQLLGGLLNTDAVLGAGWAGNIRNAGFKGETTLLKPVMNTENYHSWDILSTISADYAFKNGWYGSVAFLYNSAGANKLKNIESFYATRLTLRSLMPFTYSWCVLVNKSFTPVFGANAAAIYSATSNAFIAVPSLNYSIADNWDLLFTGQLFFAQQNSQYTTLGNSLFLRMKVAF